MAEIKLVPKGKIGITVEAEVIRPDAFAKLSKEEIEKLQVWQGPRELPLSEFFDVDVWNDDLAGLKKFFSDPGMAKVFGELFEGMPEIKVFTDKGWYRW